MMTVIWDALTQAGQTVVEWLVAIFSGLVGVFYEAPTTEGGTGSLTFLGVMAIIALTVGVAFVVIKWISSFVTLNRG